MTRVRFICPPSGGLLVAGARVALANHAFARNRQGTFVLRPGGEVAPRPEGEVAPRPEGEGAPRPEGEGAPRPEGEVAPRPEGEGAPRAEGEDTPRAEADSRTLNELRWLGVQWDEIVPPGDYAGAIQHLKDTGRLYPCFESEIELRAKREFRIKRGKPATYDRAMLKMTAAQRAAAEAGGKVPYWRFRLSARILTWNDMIAGKREVKLPAVSDPILVLSDGTPTPALTAVVDDVADGITHVIRAEEGDGATGVYLELLEAFGESPDHVQFGHLPVLGDTGRLTIRALRADGVEAEALSRWIGAGGRFSPRQFARKPDPEALPAINREVLSRREFSGVADRLPPGATDAFWLAIRGHIDLLNEARHWWDVVAGTIFPEIPEGAEAAIAAALASLPDEPWDGGTWDTWRKSFPDGGEASIRLLLTGDEQGPDTATMLPLIGRARVLARLRGG